MDEFHSQVAPITSMPNSLFGRITPNQRAVLEAIASHGQDCRPGIDRVAFLACLHRSTVLRIIPQLVSMNLLQVEQRFEANGQQTSNRYRLNLWRACALAEDANPPALLITAAETPAVPVNELKPQYRQAVAQCDPPSSRETGHGGPPPPDPSDGRPSHSATLPPRGVAEDDTGGRRERHKENPSSLEAVSDTPPVVPSSLRSEETTPPPQGRSAIPAAGASQQPTAADTTPANARQPGRQQLPAYLAPHRELLRKWFKSRREQHQIATPLSRQELNACRYAEERGFLQPFLEAAAFNAWQCLADHHRQFARTAVASYSDEFQHFRQTYLAISNRAMSQSWPRAWAQYRRIKAQRNLTDRQLFEALQRAIAVQAQMADTGRGYASPFPDAARWLSEGRFEDFLDGAPLAAPAPQHQAAAEPITLRPRSADELPASAKMLAAMQARLAGGAA